MYRRVSDYEVMYKLFVNDLLAGAYRAIGQRDPVPLDMAARMPSEAE
jgi:hypothetical protein